MKKIIVAILLLLTWLLFSCAEQPEEEKQSTASDQPKIEIPVVIEPVEPVTPIVEQEPEPIPIPETPIKIETTPEIIEPVVIEEPPPLGPEPEPKPILLSISTTAGLYAYNGESIELLDTRQNIPLPGRKFLTGNSIIQFDATGDQSIEMEFDSTPDTIAFQDEDVWTCTMITPVEAIALGGRYKYYSEIFLNNISQGHWVFNPYQCIDLLVTSDGSVILTTETGLKININGENERIHTAINNGLLIYNYSAVSRTATANGTAVLWSTNYMANANRWQLVEEVWYSNNGYEFGMELIENQTGAMWAFNEYPYPGGMVNGEKPTLESVGVDGFDVYWIECNSGWLIKHNTQSDQLTKLFRLWDGDGYRASGLIASENLAPALVGNKLYYHYNGTVFELNLETGFSMIFYNGFGIVIAW